MVLTIERTKLVLPGPITKKVLMIPRTITTWQSLSWQEELSQLITDPETLLDLVQLDKTLLPQAKKAAELFPLRTTPSFARRIRPGDINDPLLRQILPIDQELHSPMEYSTDPLAEVHSTVAKGLIHKYEGRVLLVAASQCAINCRYCFRRHFDYAGNTPSRGEWQAALTYIQQNDSIEEVILSGGDPLAISDKQIQWLISEICQIPHITRLRIHTRLPIVLPSRMTSGLLDILSQHRLQSVLVVHCNHAQEIDEEVSNALQAIAQAGITLLNQTVLLRGINDDANSLTTLSKRLFSARALPYYLHLLDKVNGASHFNVEESDAIDLHRQLLASLPGYLVPKLVKEVPDKPSKVPINY
ncbi:L-lysine 2,3-aminomutase [Thalassocella blandensis]|nr:L-lysine 2,3-aminomutase [Thalassocella blandensis]